MGDFSYLVPTLKPNQMLIRTHARRLLAAGVLLAAAFVACTKTGERATLTDEGLVLVRIHAGGVDAGAMTKDGGGVDAILAAAYPASVSLKLTNTLTGITYDATTGAAVLLPVGAYSVTGRYKPRAEASFTGSAYFAASPSFEVSAGLEVVAGVTDYAVPVEWTCCALCVDTGEVLRWRWYDMGGTAADVPALAGESAELVFFCGSVDNAAMRVALTPADLEHYAATDWWLSSSRAQVADFANGLVVQSGRWYRLHPDGVVTESGALSLGFPAWVCGSE